MKLDENRLTKIFRCISGLKATTKWVEDVTRDAMESGLIADVILNANEFRSRTDNIKTSKEKPPKRRPELIISEDQRKIRSERMRRFWEKKKRLTKNP